MEKNTLNSVTSKQAKSTANAYYSSSLDFVSDAPQDISVLSTEFYPVHSSYSLDNQFSPLEYNIFANNSQYIDLSNSYFEFKCKLVKSDGTDLSSSENIGPVTNLFHSLFESLEIYLNNVQVCKTTNLYPIRAYLNRLLGFTAEQKKSLLESEFWIPDTIPDNLDPNSNTGFKSRMQKAKKNFSLVGKLAEGFLNQPRYLFPNNDLKIRLKRSPANFYLLEKDASTDITAKVKILNATFHCRKVVVNPTIHSAQLSQLNKGAKFRYNFKNAEVYSCVIGSGSQTFSTETLWSNQLPELLIISFLNAEALTGNPKLSPFNFQHFKVAEISIMVDSDVIMKRSLDFDFDSDDFYIGYNTLCQLNGPDKPCGITSSEFKKGSFFAIFNLFQSFGHRFATNQGGQLRISVSFKSALTEGITMIAYAQTAASIAIDNNKNVYLSYAN